MRKYPLEKEIQKACLDYLALKGIFAFKIYNGGIYKKATGSYIKAQTLGVPDIIAHWPLDTITYFEIKSKTGRQSKDQKAFQSQCEADEVRYFIIRSLDDLEKVLER